MGRGLITELVFYGDFMAAADQTPLTEALRGVPLTEAAISGVLARFDLPRMFGGIRESEIVALMTDRAGGR